MTTITIRINGQKIMLISPCSLNQALYTWSTMNTGSNPDVCNEALESDEQSDVNSDRKRYVIALNQTFVPRSQYQNTRLTSGDIIELLFPMAGG
jgi:thiamine biosynthesis protein ThiS